jgi:hypothetical protein
MDRARDSTARVLEFPSHNGHDHGILSTRNALFRCRRDRRTRAEGSYHRVPFLEILGAHGTMRDRDDGVINSNGCGAHSPKVNIRVVPLHPTRICKHQPQEEGN